ncbi:MAG: hypothetical protein ACRBN8_30620 [Nannocystales bacterium]
MTGSANVLLVLALLGLACTPASPPSVQPAPAKTTPVRDPVELRWVDLSIVSTVELYLDTTPVTCSWGSSGVASADAPVPYWVIGMVDVDVDPRITLSELSIGGLWLFDEQNNPMGRADREFELRLATSEHDGLDLSRHGTTPVTTPLAPGTHRLWFRARMSDRFSPERGTPVRDSLLLRVDSMDAMIEGPVGPPWPTA